ncbi:DNA cytosine methyltransferase [Streptomyces sp. ISL-10]|uniref:DNA cytosine methyltransferase n=1 Tax=Streptomyces sp. ISL-10 TaxID=2819172 RepID=UPI002034F4A4|nr:DNA cytosine methyltransferase [Streptomyces sp. ISL-10]
MAVRSVLGGDLVWVADPDPGAARILAHHHPQVPNLEDITTVGWADVPSVDVLLGGYPCQPFSTAGRRKGTADDRHIWPHIARALGVLRPRIAIFENVAGHLRLGFDTVLADLARLGFDAEWCLVRASEVGAPHRRERLFILATAADASGREPERRGVAGVLGGPSAAEPRQGDQRQWAGDTPGHRRSAAPNSPSIGLGHSGPQGFGGLAPTAVAGGAAADANSSGFGRREGRPEPARIEGGSDAASSGAPDWGKFAPAVARWEHATGRRAPRATDDRRRLSPAFVEWLMGLPAGHVTDVPGLTRTQQLKALGNGVVPRQAEAALRLLAARAELHITPSTHTPHRSPHGIAA